MSITFEMIQKERNMLILDKIYGHELDLSNLRKMCLEYQEKTDYKFQTETDEELWNSVNDYLNNHIGLSP